MRACDTRRSVDWWGWQVASKVPPWSVVCCMPVNFRKALGVCMYESLHRRIVCFSLKAVLLSGVPPRSLFIDKVGENYAFPSSQSWPSRIKRAVGLCSWGYGAGNDCFLSIASFPTLLCSRFKIPKIQKIDLKKRSSWLQDPAHPPTLVLSTCHTYPLPAPLSFSRYDMPTCADKVAP